MIDSRLDLQHNLQVRVTILFVIVVFLCSEGVLAQSKKDQSYYAENGHVEFRSSVPTHEFTGESDYLVGRIDLSQSVVDFYLDLATLDTGIQERDEDMYATLHVEEHPFAEFFGTLMTSVDFSLKEPQEARVQGEFTLNGITQSIDVQGSLEPKENGLLLKADWEVDLTDYDIEPPGILFYRVSDVQKVNISILLTPGGP
jgi:polyisoprenoid-binding protein YceI